MLRDAAIPFACILLIGLFITIQFLAKPLVLGNIGLLSSAETTSPRSTLEGFRANVTRASSLLIEAYRQNVSEPGFIPNAAVKEKVREADVLLARAARALDLRNVPPIELEHHRLEASLLLKEILDRLPLPDPVSIPGNEEVAKGAVPGWSIPGTEIRIVRISDGVQAGEYLFSSETVQRLDEFYRLIRDQPNADSSSEDIYDFFSQSPGYLLPPKWYNLIEALPGSLRTSVQGQAVWQWIALVLTLFVAILGTLGFRRLLQFGEPTSNTTGSLLASIVMPATVAVAALFVVYMADYQINLTGQVNNAVEEIGEATAYLAAMWGILRFSNAFAGELTLSRSESIDAHLARAAIRIAGIAIALTLLIYGASYLGIPLAGLLAGLGVGGLAVALAAKPTLENFIGGLILYADRPVRVGDLCRFGDLEGRVKEIGLRSTRIRGLDRSLITIPNATFVNMNIINLTNRDRMPYHRVVALNSSDSADIRREIEGLATFFAGHPKIEQDSLQIRLREGHEEKPKAEISALILTSKWEEFLQIQQDVDLMLRDAVVAGDKEHDAPAGRDHVFPLKEV
ncbi:mechanosensitive ion channel family protein [Microvirga guangxiensis]|uniref:mechanosensitive ion channel family protein n=1 Tax=Microvirga guangxiensis TaxID=549386 RepID=UPI000B838C17|nr:mechanosensitive ion channel domain-containing protein [Microvirga guangxiensis]